MLYKETLRKKRLKRRNYRTRRRGRQFWIL